MRDRRTTKITKLGFRLVLVTQSAVRLCLYRSEMVLSRMERLNSNSIRGRTFQIRISFLTDLDSELAGRTVSCSERCRKYSVLSRPRRSDWWGWWSDRRRPERSNSTVNICPPVFCEFKRSKNMQTTYDYLATIITSEFIGFQASCHTLG